MKLRNALFSSVAVAGIVLGAASYSGARAAEVSSDAWSGFYLGIGAGGSASIGDVDATGYGDSDFSGGWSGDVGSNDNFVIDADDSSGSSWTYSGDADIDVHLGRGYDVGLEEFGSFEALEQILNSGKAGFLGQAELGADYESNGLVLGINGSFGFSKLKQKVAASSLGNLEFSGDDDSSGDVSATTSTELKFGNKMTVGARAGFLATPSTLLFAGGGYARQKVTLGADFAGNFDGFVSGDSDSGGFSGSYDISATETEWANGYYVGGGVEQMVGSGAALKLEYRFTDLGSISTSNEVDGSSLYGSGGGTFDDWDTGVAAKADLQTHAVTATLNFRF